jgi:hypothetical protein
VTGFQQRRARRFAERGCVEDQPQQRPISKPLESFNHAIWRTLPATHRQNMSQKLGLSGSHSLLKFAYDHKSSLG